MISSKSIFISDIHLGTKSCKAKRLHDFLSNIECENLFLVGDIIDGWALRRKHYWTKHQTEVIRKILKISETTTVVYIPGNHDEFIRPFFKFDFQIGDVQILDTMDYVAIDGRRILITHGDKHDFWMKVPRQIVNLLAHFTEWKEEAEKINKSVKRYKRISATESDIIKFAKRNKYDAVICGHTHVPKIVDSYMNTGDWTGHCSAIIEHYDGSWELYYHK